MVIALVIATVFAGAVIKGVLGMGLPLLAVPVLSLVMDVPSALTIVAVPMIFTNIWQIWQFRAARSQATFLSRYLASGVLGITLGTWLLSIAPASVLEIALGSVVLAYLLLRVSRPGFRLGNRTGLLLAPIIGGSAGVLHGATGLSGVVGVSYFNALSLSRGAYMFATASMFLMFSLLQIPLLASVGMVRTQTLLYGFVSLIPAGLGLVVGNMMAKSLRPAAFDKAVLVVLLFSALPLIWRGLPI